MPYYLSSFLLRHEARVVKVGPVHRGIGASASWLCTQWFLLLQLYISFFSSQYFLMMMQLKDLCVYHLFTDKPSFSPIYIILKNQYIAECLTYQISSCQPTITLLSPDETWLFHTVLPTSFRPSAYIAGFFFSTRFQITNNIIEKDDSKVILSWILGFSPG